MFEKLSLLVVLVLALFLLAPVEVFAGGYPPWSLHGEGTVESQSESGNLAYHNHIVIRDDDGTRYHAYSMTPWDDPGVKNGERVSYARIPGIGYAHMVSSERTRANEARQRQREYERTHR